MGVPLYKENHFSLKDELPSRKLCKRAADDHCSQLKINFYL